MTNVLHMKTGRPRYRRFDAVAAALAIGLSAACAAALAGQAGSSFRITINVLPETPASCSANASGGSPQVTCRPSVVGVAAQASEGSRDPTVLRYRTDAGMRLAGEMIEIGNENYYAWVDSDRMAWSQTSSRLVVARGREYVEMTVSW